MRRSWLVVGVLACAQTIGCAGCGSDGGAAAGDADGGPDVVFPPVRTECDAANLAAGCSAGRCRIDGAKDAIGSGDHVVITERSVPPELVPDVYGAVVCDVDTARATLAGPLTLSILFEGAPLDPSLFRYRAQGVSSLIQSSVSGGAAVGVITEGGTFGLTRRPGPWTTEGIAGVDVTLPTDAASRLRDISSRGIGAAFWDGTHLFVGNGNRVLVYDGMPSDPTAAPKLVVGQPDLAANLTIASASVITGGVQGIWSNGTKLVVSTSNRVLIWNALPTTSFAPADLVLGQPDFSSVGANSGGISASSLALPTAIDSDGTRLAIADTLNNRVLVWSAFPTSIGQAASGVMGQGDFTSNMASAGAAPIYQTWGVALQGSGAFVTGHYTSAVMYVPTTNGINTAPAFYLSTGAPRVQPDVTWTPSGVARAGAGLAVRDPAGRRIDMLRAAPTQSAPFDFFLGQPDPDRAIDSLPNASTLLAVPSHSVSANGGYLLAPDGNRLLVFQSPTYSYEPASLVLGQAGFGTNERAIDYRGISERTLGLPADVAVSGNTVAVADRGNNRVLLFDKTSLRSAAPAARVVLGQPDATSYVANLDLKSPSAARMAGPAGVALDGTHLIVADTENHRVLVWNSIPTTSGVAADIVLGQADFSGRRPNRGRGDANLDGRCDAGADGMFYPKGVASDGTRLFVADQMNNRVLYWSSFPTVNGQAADGVIGQPDFTSSAPNRGSGWATPNPFGLSLPSGVTLVGTALWIADTENNRVVRYDDVTTLPSYGAVLGQPDAWTLSNPNSYPPASANAGGLRQVNTTAGSVLRPRAVAVTSNRIFVSETDSNRVHMFDVSSLAHAGVLGQTSDIVADPNAGGIGAASLAAPLGMATDGETLFVADARNHRVLGYSAATPPAPGAAATIVIGQSSMVSNAFNQGSTASAKVSSRPRGLFVRDKELYVADTEHHRVLVFDAPPGSAPPKRVIGQADVTLVLPNGGGLPSSRTMRSPRGVFVDAQRIVVCDTGNHRVLVFDRLSSAVDASLVLGQAGFDVGSLNRGGAPSAATLAAPEGVWSDGTRLFVADTGNHRVLVWNAFPTSNGQPADVILGQDGPTSVLPNRGQDGATATTMSFPSAVRIEGGALFVADTGNNRVLRFNAVTLTSGAAADGVLGQADLSSRASAQTPNDAAHLAGPSALASDGAYLYVADRDLARVVAFALPAAGLGPAPATSLGAPAGLTLSGPSGLAAEATPLFTTRLYVSDTNADRIVILGSLSRLAR